MREKIENLTLVALASFIVSGIFLFALQPVFSANVPGTNYNNVSVWTQVNITNAQPEFMSIVIEDPSTSSIVNVTLNAGLTRTVYCNATVRDWNGINDNITLNATFFDQGQATLFGANDENDHYTNGSCTLLPGSPYGQNNVYGNYTCTFDVYYYANNGTWNCTMFAVDVQGPINYTVNESNTTTVLPLYALNVTDGIDYGIMAVGESSGDVEANITNFGNMAINLTVQGYGETVGDGLALVCNSSTSAWNISIQYEAYDVTNGTPFSSKHALTGAIQTVANFSLSQQTSTVVMNSTYWELNLPVVINPYGVCNGWVVFSAIAG